VRSLAQTKAGFGAAFGADPAAVEVDGPIPGVTGVMDPVGTSSRDRVARALTAPPRRTAGTTLPRDDEVAAGFAGVAGAAAGAEDEDLNLKRARASAAEADATSTRAASEMTAAFIGAGRPWAILATIGRADARPAGYCRLPITGRLRKMLKIT
jgi:hypothetical protein